MPSRRNLRRLPRVVHGSMAERTRAHNGDDGTSQADHEPQERPPEDERHCQPTYDTQGGSAPWGTLHDDEADRSQKHDGEQDGTEDLVAVAVRPEVVGAERECDQEAHEADESDDAEKIGSHDAQRSEF